MDEVAEIDVIREAETIKLRREIAQITAKRKPRAKSGGDLTALFPDVPTGAQLPPAEAAP
jgi:hypothetical protein